MSDDHSPPGWLQRAARLGYVARGTVYVVVGMTALAVAATGDDTAGRRGALRTLAEQPFGNGLLLATASGFAGYALWRWLQAGNELRGDLSLAAAWRGGFYAVRGTLYGATAWYAVGIVADAERGEATRAPLLALPPASIVVVGLVVAGYAAFLAYRGVTRDFEDDLATDQMSERTRRTIAGLGVAGHVARAVAIGIIAAIMVSTGLGVDPVEDLGFDRAVGELSDASAGPWLLTGVGLGLIAFGLFSYLQARYRRIEVPSGGADR